MLIKYDNKITKYSYFSELNYEKITYYIYIYFPFLLNKIINTSC